jgi:oligopeptide transport system substrate-binding protein
MVAGIQRLMLEWVNYVPTVTRSSATLYGENIEITWPAYSVAFGWGANRYRYINTDPDFAEGLYNSFAE